MHRCARVGVQASHPRVRLSRRMQKSSAHHLHAAGVPLRYRVPQRVQGGPAPDSPCARQGKDVSRKARSRRVREERGALMRGFWPRVGWDEGPSSDGRRKAHGSTWNMACGLSNVLPVWLEVGVCAKRHAKKGRGEVATGSRAAAAQRRRGQPWRGHALGISWHRVGWAQEIKLIVCPR